MLYIQLTTDCFMTDRHMTHAKRTIKSGIAYERVGLYDLAIGLYSQAKHRLKLSIGIKKEHVNLCDSRIAMCEVMQEREDDNV